MPVSGSVGDAEHVLPGPGVGLHGVGVGSLLAVAMVPGSSGGPVSVGGGSTGGIPGSPSAPPPLSRSARTPPLPSSSAADPSSSLRPLPVLRSPLWPLTVPPPSPWSAGVPLSPLCPGVVGPDGVAAGTEASTGGFPPSGSPGVPHPAAPNPRSTAVTTAVAALPPLTPPGRTRIRFLVTICNTSRPVEAGSTRYRHCTHVRMKP